MLMIRPVLCPVLRPVLRSFAAFAVLLVIAAGCTGCGSIPIAEEDVFMPKPSITAATFQQEGVTLQEHTIMSPGTQRDSAALDAWWLVPDDAEPVVLFFGGQGFYLVQSSGYVDAFASLPARALLWDYRGYGKSEGAPDVRTVKRDALAVYDYVVNELGVAPDRLVVHGHSLGAFVATFLAEQRTVGGVVLENPATNVSEWGNTVIPWYLRAFIGFEFADALRQENNRARIADLQGPLLIVGGANDMITAPEMAETLYEDATTSRKELVIVEEGGHNELYATEAMQEAYRALLEAVMEGHAAQDEVAGAGE